MPLLFAYTCSLIYDAVYIILAAEQGGGVGVSDQTACTCRLIFLFVARKFLLNKLAYYQDIEKQGTERTVQMCMLICLIVVRKHDTILIHCSNIALKSLQRCRLICVIGVRICQKPGFHMAYF